MLGCQKKVAQQTSVKNDFGVRVKLSKKTLNHLLNRTAIVAGPDPDWQLGTKLRHLGSLHSDTWTGTAADLAEHGVLAVYPVAGWWKVRKKLELYHKKARYVLIISIHTPETDVDLYTAIENLLAVEV